MSIISYISFPISQIANRKIVVTQNSLRHRFWLAAPKISAQIRPWVHLSVLEKERAHFVPAPLSAPIDIISF